MYLLYAITAADPYLAIAFFQLGNICLQMREYSRAAENFATAFGLLRDHDFIDYQQLGIEVVLSKSTILHNRALAYGNSGSWDRAADDIRNARTCVMCVGKQGELVGALTSAVASKSLSSIQPIQPLFCFAAPYLPGDVKEKKEKIDTPAIQHQIVPGAAPRTATPAWKDPPPSASGASYKVLNAGSSSPPPSRPAAAAAAAASSSGNSSSYVSRDGSGSGSGYKPPPVAASAKPAAAPAAASRKPASSASSASSSSPTSPRAGGGGGGGGGASDLEKQLMKTKQDYEDAKNNDDLEKCVALKKRIKELEQKMEEASKGGARLAEVEDALAKLKIQYEDAKEADDLERAMKFKKEMKTLETELQSLRK